MPAAPAFRVSVDEHVAAVGELIAAVRDRPEEIVALEDALGRVTAAGIASPVPLPMFRNSQMDGYAVRSADVAAAGPDDPVVLPVVAEIPAAPGAPAPLPAGAAARIMTGAPVPSGADAIVPVEDTDAGTAEVRIGRPRGPGAYVRETGSDLAAGAPLIPAGRRLASRHLAALAAAGITDVAVRAAVRIAVVSTGSELASPGSAPGPGEVFDANGPALVAAGRAVGAEVVLQARVRDDADEFLALLDAAVDSAAEVVVTSGGVSMGEHEVVRETLEPLGARVGSVAMQPGGPQGLARYRGVPVLCFPGNPVSSQLSFELFLAPVLRDLAALPPASRERRPLAHPVDSVAGKRQFLRGMHGSDGTVRTLAGPGSHLVAALAAADLLLVIPEPVEHLDAGETVETVTL